MNGHECGPDLHQQTWSSGVVWRDADEQVMWRADETELLLGALIGSMLAVDPSCRMGGGKR